MCVYIFNLFLSVQCIPTDMQIYNIYFFFLFSARLLGRGRDSQAASHKPLSTFMRDACDLSNEILIDAFIHL